jgi:hypothetical protein
MDLKALLASNKAKTERSTMTHKPVEIADKDRPYTLTDAPTTILEDTSTSTLSASIISYSQTASIDPAIAPLESNIENESLINRKKKKTGNKVATKPTTQLTTK